MSLFKRRSSTFCLESTQYREIDDGLRKRKQRCTFPAKDDDQLARRVLVTLRLAPTTLALERFGGSTIAGCNQA